jgi:alpha-L-fucosidase
VREYPLLKAHKRQSLPSEENSHPAEVCDCITPGGWFWKSNMTYKSVTSAAEVVAMLKVCNSRQANYLLNVPPDRTGRIPEWLVARLQEIGQRSR